MTDQRSVTTSPAPEVIVEAVVGNLQVKGWEQNEVQARSTAEGGLALEEQADTVRLSCQGDCALRLPYGASLRVVDVQGDARFKLLEDQIDIDRVHGSLGLRNVGPVRIQTLSGNLEAKYVSGDLRLEQVQGNATVRNVEGMFFAERVVGNLDLRNVEGDIRAEVTGNARLRLSSLDGERYQVEAQGNLDCRIPEGASARVDLSSAAETIELRLVDQRQTLRQPDYSLSLGEGEAEVVLSAGGMVFFGVQEAGWTEPEEVEFGFGAGFDEEFGRRISEQVEEQVQSHITMLNEQLSRLSEALGRAGDRAGMTEAEAERIMRRARERTERATTRAQEKIARAQEKLQRKMEAAQRKAEQRARTSERRSQAHGRHSWNFEWQTGPQSPASARESGDPVTDEERLMVLRMLEQKKITLEEAEKLLAALEGKGK